MWVELSIALGVLSGATAGFSLHLSVKALRAPSEANGDVLRAFKALEADFSDQEDRVRSALGRISRLKREILPVRDADNGCAAIPQGGGGGAEYPPRSCGDSGGSCGFCIR